jgi:hypothetical protein
VIESNNSNCPACSLTRYSSSTFTGSALRVNPNFVSVLRTVEQYAQACNVKLYVTSSFRYKISFEFWCLCSGVKVRWLFCSKSGQVISGAVVQPASRSNHFVGRAFDFNVQRRSGSLCNSACLRNYNSASDDVKCFIS